MRKAFDWKRSGISMLEVDNIKDGDNIKRQEETHLLAMDNFFLLSR
jgi:hypothetical protein